MWMLGDCFRNWVTRCCAVVLIALGFGGGAVAETRALLIGVSDYDEAAGITDLKGPANDVMLMARVLEGRGLSQITVLADNVPGAKKPTRAAILEALAAQADMAQPGDFVYIHLSGHGTRQADLNGDETDGLDEVFLPADVRRAELGSKAIPNALVDDEIGAAVRAIRMRGADVWLVMDSCHSGSGIRGAASDTVARYVDPAALGISVAPSQQVETNIVDENGPEPSGGFLAFYAARSTEVAREVNLSRDPDTEAWYGLFTAKLAARLEGGEGLSFRQLFQSVLSDLNDDSVPGGARMQTPLWEGTLIDAAVFGGGDTVGLRRFAVTGDELFAGLLHGIGEGTLVGLVADAADAADDIIGYAQTESTSATFSYLRPVDPACVPMAAAPCAYAGNLPDAARFAQVIARPLDRQLRLGWPVDLATGQAMDPEADIALALVKAATDVGQGDGFRVNLSDTDYRVETLWDGTSLWFGLQAMQGQTPVGLQWTPGTDDLTAVLTRIAKAEDLARMLGAVAGGGSILSPNPIEISADHTASDVADLVDVGSKVSPSRECRAALGRMRGKPALPLEAHADLKQCDKLQFSAKGSHLGSRDVNRVHIDAQFCVHVAYERIEGGIEARKLGPNMTMCSDCGTGYGAGEERMFVVVTQSPENAEALNLEGLLENCGPALGGTRGGAAVDAMAFLTRMGQRPDTRGAFGGLGLTDVWVKRYDWRVLPRQEVFVRIGRSLD